MVRFSRQNVLIFFLSWNWFLLFKSPENIKGYSKYDENINCTVGQIMYGYIYSTFLTRNIYIWVDQNRLFLITSQLSKVSHIKTTLSLTITVFDSHFWGLLEGSLSNLDGCPHLRRANHWCDCYVSYCYYRIYSISTSRISNDVLQNTMCDTISLWSKCFWLLIKNGLDWVEISGKIKLWSSPRITVYICTLCLVSMKYDCT